MNLDCACGYDPADIYRAAIRRARNRHSCDECGGAIEPGDRYEYVFGVWEWCASTWRTCERCCEIRQWVKNNVPCLCWAHGSMIDDCREAVEDAVYRARAETVGLRFGLLRRIHLRDTFYAERARKSRRNS